MSYKREYIYGVLNGVNVVNRMHGLAETDRLAFVTSIGVVRGRLIERKPIPDITDETSEEEIDRIFTELTASYGEVTVFDIAKMMVKPQVSDFNEKAESIELSDVEIYDYSNQLILRSSIFTLFSDQIIGLIPELY